MQKHKSEEGSGRCVQNSKARPEGSRKDLPWIVPSLSHCMHRAEFILHKGKGNCSFKKKSSYIADTDLYTHTYIFYWQIKKDQIFNEIRMGLGGELELNSPDFHGTSIKRVSEELLKAKHLPLKA